MLWVATADGAVLGYDHSPFFDEGEIEGPTVEIPAAVGRDAGAVTSLALVDLERVAVATVDSEQGAGAELRTVDLVCERAADQDADELGVQGVRLPDGAMGFDVAVSKDGGDAYVLYRRGGGTELAWIDREAGEMVDLNGEEFGRPKPPIAGGEEVAVERGGRVLVAAGGAGRLHELAAEGGDEGWFIAHDLPLEDGPVRCVAGAASPGLAIVGAGRNVGRVALGEEVANRVVTPGAGGQEGAVVAVATDPVDSNRSYAVLRTQDGTWQARLLAFDVTADSTERPWEQGALLHDDADPAAVAERWRLAVSPDGVLVFAGAVGGSTLTAFHRSGQRVGTIALPAPLTDMAASRTIPSERCDDIDNDCDGETDEELPDFVVNSVLAYEQGHEAMASHGIPLWDGRGWAAAFRAQNLDAIDDGVWLRRFDGDGRIVGEDVRLLEFGDPFELVQIGDDVLIVHRGDDGRSSSARVALDGRRLVGPAVLPVEWVWSVSVGDGGQVGARATRVREHVAVAGVERLAANQDRISLLLLDEDGTLVQGPLFVDDAPDSSLSSPVPAANDEHLGLLWRSNQGGLQFARVGLPPEPFQVEGRVQLAATADNDVDLLWDGGRWLAAYAVEEVCWFHPISALGEPGDGVVVGVGELCQRPALAADGDGLLWARYRDGDAEVRGFWLGRLTTAGVPVGESLLVRSATTTKLHRLAVHGRHYAVAYTGSVQRRHGAQYVSEPYTAFAITALGCPDGP